MGKKGKCPAYKKKTEIRKTLRGGPYFTKGKTEKVTKGAVVWGKGESSRGGGEGAQTKNRKTRRDNRVSTLVKGVGGGVGGHGETVKGGGLEGQPAKEKDAGGVVGGQ